MRTLHARAMPKVTRHAVCRYATQYVFFFYARKRCAIC